MDAYGAFTVDIVPATIWTVIESNLTIISACLIVSRPFFIRIYPQKLISFIQDISSHRSTNSQSSKWEESPRVRMGKFKPLTDAPPVVTNVSLGNPFEVDVEKGNDISKT